MKQLIASVSTIIALSLPAFASASTWNIDPEHSNVGFKVKHLMISNVKGNFEKHSGTVEINDKDITKSKVEVTIDTNSINTNVQKRDEHLRSSDFFDVAKYPAMTFVSKKVVKADHGKQESKDPWGNIRRGTSASTKINRKDFGLTWNKALETGGVVVGDEITINLEIEMIKAQPK